MPESGKFLDYYGPVDYKIIDRLLMDLKKSKGYISLPKTVARRVYAITVECLENIAKHSLRKSHTGNIKQPFISASDINDKIIITTSNPVLVDKKASLERILDHLNQLDQDTLTHLYEEIINRELNTEDNGAGLGFIIMRLRSANKIDYCFTVINNCLSDFELKISVNKNIMRKLIIEQTTNTPEVNFDPEKNMFEISGESRPPDVNGFYDEILNWFDEYSSLLMRSQESNEPVIFNLDFEYFNSSSAKYILDFCKQIAAIRSKEKNVGVRWHYEKDDYDMLEAGKEMSRISKVPFEYYLKENKENKH